MCESVNLIMSVETHPCIWDNNNSDYHDRDVKDVAWDQICREVIDDWDNCKDKINKCTELKKKWTHIRDYHRKKVLNTKTVSNGSVVKKSKSYVYSQLLHFLTPIFTKRDSDGNCTKDDSDCNLPQSDNDEDTVEHEEIVYIESPANSVAGRKRKKRVPTQISMTSGVEDDDTKFLLSFRGYMKNMDYHQKLDFKMGMLRLVRKVNMRGDPTSSQNDNDSDD